MIISLTLPNSPKKFSSDYFYPEIFSLPEYYTPPYANSSELMNPNKVLKILKLETKYLETPPFYYIRSYASIWEYFLIALYMHFNPENGVDASLYRILCSKPSKNFLYFGNGFHAVGNADFNDWKRAYLKRFENPPEKEIKYLKSLLNETKPFVESLINRRVPTRQYHRLETEFIKERKKAAKCFLKFLVKENLDNEFVRTLSTKRSELDQLELLLGYYERNKKLGSYNHILSVSLLLCLYGRQDGWITKSFCLNISKKIKNLPLSDQKSKIFRKFVIDALDNAVRSNADDSWIRPPLAFIYKERDQISIQKRISSWLHLLKGCVDAERY